MGWWGTDVLSGDEPLDILSAVGEQLDVDLDATDLYPDGVIADVATRNKIARYVTEAGADCLYAIVDAIIPQRTEAQLTEDAEQLAGDGELIETVIRDLRVSLVNQRRIAAQVVGVVLMAAGAPLSDRMRFMLRSAADNDGWADVDEDRAASMDRFSRTVRDYTDGIPTAVGAATLMTHTMLPSQPNTGNC